MKPALAALLVVPLAFVHASPPAQQLEAPRAAAPAPSRPQSAWRCADRLLAHLKVVNSPRTRLALTYLHAQQVAARADAPERVAIAFGLACSPVDETATRAAYDALFARLREEPALFALKKPALRPFDGDGEWKVDGIDVAFLPDVAQGDLRERGSAVNDVEALVRDCASRESIEIAPRFDGVDERRVLDQPWVETRIDLSASAAPGLALGRIRGFLDALEESDPRARVVRLDVKSIDREHQAWTFHTSISHVRPAAIAQAVRSR